MVNVTGEDAPPPGVGLATVTVAVPAVAIRELVTVTVIVVLVVLFIGRTVVVLPEVHDTTEPDRKCVPVIVSVKEAPPCFAVFGLRDVTVGTGLLTVKVRELELLEPGLTAVIVAAPAVVRSAAGMLIVSCVLET